MKFVTFGETMAQYNATYAGAYGEGDEYILDCAGAESNVAVDIEKLGVPGLRTVWVSRVGNDEGGDFVLRELQGRTTVAAEKHNGQNTGVSYLNHLPDDEHVKTYQRKGSAASMLPFDEVEPHLRDADILHVTGITPALSEICYHTVFEALRYANANNIPVSFDLNYRGQLWSPDGARPVFEDMLRYSTLFKIGHDEAETIWAKDLTAEGYAKFFRQMQEMSEGLVVVTRGSTGAVAYDGVNLVEHPGYEVEVVDPVGAGDAFVAGFLANILEKHSIKSLLGLDDTKRATMLYKSLEIANVCGALTCTRRGDTGAMPTMNEVIDFIKYRV